MFFTQYIQSPTNRASLFLRIQEMNKREDPAAVPELLAIYLSSVGVEVKLDVGSVYLNERRLLPAAAILHALSPDELLATLASDFAYEDLDDAPILQPKPTVAVTLLELYAHSVLNHDPHWDLLLESIIACAKKNQPRDDCCHAVAELVKPMLCVQESDDSLYVYVAGDDFCAIDKLCCWSNKETLTRFIFNQMLATQRVGHWRGESSLLESYISNHNTKSEWWLKFCTKLEALTENSERAALLRRNGISHTLDKDVLKVALLPLQEDYILDKAASRSSIEDSLRAALITTLSEFAATPANSSKSGKRTRGEDDGPSSQPETSPRKWDPAQGKGKDRAE